MGSFAIIGFVTEEKGVLMRLVAIVFTMLILACGSRQDQSPEGDEKKGSSDFLVGKS